MPRSIYKVPQLLVRHADDVGHVGEGQKNRGILLDGGDQLGLIGRSLDDRREKRRGI